MWKRRGSAPPFLSLGATFMAEKELNVRVKIESPQKLNGIPQPVFLKKENY